MRVITISLKICLAALVLTGCNLPKQPSNLAGSRHLPVDWMAVSVNDWRFQALPEANQEQVLATRDAIKLERASAYFRFYRRYSDDLLKRIDDVQESASQAFLVSPAVVNAHLTPELFSTAHTYDEARYGFALETNENIRSLKEDWARIWLLDKPSRLSPYPITPSSGNP